MHRSRLILIAAVALLALGLAACGGSSTTTTATETVTETQTTTQQDTEQGQTTANAGGTVYTEPLQFMNSDNAIADALAISNALTAAGIAFSTVTRSGTYPLIAYTITGVLGDFTIIPVKTPNGSCEDMFTPKNLQAQYRPQIRMPTPPDDSDPIVGRPY